MTRLRLMSKITAAMVVIAVSTIGTTGAALATPSHWATEHVVFGPDVSEDYCGVQGLTVEELTVADVRFRTITHGPDGLSYLYESLDITSTWTNLATEEFVTAVGFYQGGQKRITDNGDGTLTILFQNTGDTVYSSDGQVIARDTGVFRYEAVFDHAGTPTDPSDDVFLGASVVKETGQGRDSCTAIAEAIG